MKISLAIFTRDNEYAGRLVKYLDEKYSAGGGLILSSFSEKNNFINFLKSSRVDILLMDVDLKEELREIIDNYSFQIAYLIDSPITYEDGRNFIFKYQSGKLIYKEIERICAQNNITLSMGGRGEEAYVFVMMSVGGGSGATTVAAAVAAYLAKKHKVLYLNLENLGTTNVYFDGGGNGKFDEVIAALYNNRMDLDGMLKASLLENEAGVYFYRQADHPWDVQGLEKEKIARLINSLKKSGLFEYIIIDIDRRIDEKFKEILMYANQFVVISDGTETSKEKFNRLYEYLKYLENEKKDEILPKLAIIYNKFRSKEGIKGVRIDFEKITDFGVIPLYRDMRTEQIIREMSENRVLKVFDRG